MNRFFVKDKSKIEDIEDIKHITKVLRLKENDEIEIVDEKEVEHIVLIKKIEKDIIFLQEVEEINVKRERDFKVVLYQGIPKNPKMEMICQKFTEVGGFEIVPVKFSRCVKGDLSKDKIVRLNKIMKEAAKQSKRNIIPKIINTVSFEEMVNQLKTSSFINVLFYEDEKVKTIRDFEIEIKKKINESNLELRGVNILIGPEGGIDTEEIEKLKENLGNNIEILTLGNTILRTETAGTVATSLIFYALS